MDQAASPRQALLGRQREYRTDTDSRRNYHVSIIEHDLKLGRPVFEVMRILGSSLLVKDDLLELFNGRQDDMDDNGQLELNFNC